MQNFVGMMEYLCSWVWRSADIVEGGGDCVFAVKSLPLLADDAGGAQSVAAYDSGDPVFPSARLAF